MPRGKKLSQAGVQIFRKACNMKKRGYAINEIRVYKNEEIRPVWINEKGEWYFPIVEGAGVLTESANPGRYRRALKRKLKGEEGVNQLYDLLV